MRSQVLKATWCVSGAPGGMSGPVRHHGMRIVDAMAHFTLLDAFVSSETPASAVPRDAHSRVVPEFL